MPKQACAYPILGIMVGRLPEDDEGAMGVTIHYRGTIDEPVRIRDLRRELANMAQSKGWEHNVEGVNVK